MKKLTILFFGCLLAATAHAQIGITPTEWQADLKFLQETVQQDYPFLCKKITAEEFDSMVAELDQAIPELEEHEIIAGLARVVSSFKYGHTSLGFHGGPIKFHQLPVNLYHFKDGVFIEGAHKDYENILGAKLIAIEGVPVAEALTAIRPVVPAENDQFFKAYGTNYLRTPEFLHAQEVIKELKNTINLTLERDGKTFEQEVTAIENLHMPQEYGFTKQGGDWLSVRDQNETPLYLKNLNKNYFFEYLPDQKTVYVRHSQIQDDRDEPIPAFYERLFEFVENNDVERLVLDVRLNGGGNNYKNKPIVTSVIRSKIDQPGKFFVIIGRRTFSACQNLVNELDNYTNAIFVGEPTAENINFYGDNRSIKLPNSKIPVRLSFAWWQDKPQWENGPWTPPHLAVELSFTDYCQNKDPVLQEALGFADDNFIRDPMAYFTNLFQSGEKEKLEMEAQRLVKDPKYRFFDFEPKFNKVGYDLIGDNQLEAAIYVLQQNAKLFPDSANAWDSLGEACWKADQKDKAIEHYNKAIALDPDGEIGKNAQQMLKQISTEQVGHKH